MPRPIEALVHRGALAANLETAQRAAAGARVWAVVKADAYGHGIANVFAALQRADGFALLDVGEAERLRELGWRGPILLLEGCFDGRDLETCARLSLWHVVHCSAQIDRLAALKTDRPQRVFLKLNSGMNRLGFAPAHYRAAFLRLDALPQVGEITHMTHLASADAADHAAVEPALAAFAEATADLPGERSIANSAATLRFGARLAGFAGADGASWVRPGILLYGSSPDFPERSAADWGLAPAMTLRTRLIAVQELAIGASVGYGGSFVASRPMRIGIAACGYADGYPRVAPGGNERATPVLVDGVRTRTVGRVSMDMIGVDLGPLPAACEGSEVVLWGKASNGTVLSIDEVAAAAGTVGYELMCARGAARAGDGSRLTAMAAPPVVDEAEVEITAVRAQGAGGQNVNKVSSAVHLRFDVAASSLPEGVKARLLARADRRLSEDGVLVIKAQRHRSQDLNRRDALARLNALVAVAADVPVVRRPTRPTLASKKRRLEGKSQRAGIKAGRAKVADG